MSLIQSIRKLIPLSFRLWMYSAKQKRTHANGKFYCPICENAVIEFAPHGNPPVPNILCPVCNAKACHRFAYIWFRENHQVFHRGGEFVHIAPERSLGKRIRGFTTAAGMNYTWGDIREPKHYLDIQALSLASQSIDVLFACHVLNMVPDDRLAIGEIARVLKPGGIAVLPVPYYDTLSTLREVAKDSTEAERKAAFNDPAMYRKYSQEMFAQRLTAAGLMPTEHTTNSLAIEDPGKIGVSGEAIHTAAIRT